MDRTTALHNARAEPTASAPQPNSGTTDDKRDTPRPQEPARSGGDTVAAARRRQSELSRARAAVDRIAQVRQPLEQALETELTACDAGRRVLEDARRFGETARFALEGLRDGRLSRTDAETLLTTRDAAYRAEHGALLLRLRDRLAALETPPGAMSRLAGLAPEGRWSIEGDAHGASWFGPGRSAATRPGERPKDGGDTDPGPQPKPSPLPPASLDTTAVAPFSLTPVIEIWSNGTTAFEPTADASAAGGAGNVYAPAAGILVTGGGSVCRALVGAAFDLPASCTSLVIEAVVYIDAYLFAITALPGVAGAGVDHWLRVDLGNGEVAEQNVPAGQVLAPLLWSASWHGQVEQTVTLRSTLARGPARRIRAWAGVNGHAEAGGMDSLSHALAYVTVRSIRCIAR